MTTPNLNLTTLRAELADINALLSSGVKSSNVDGTSMSFDADALRRRKTEIESQLPETRRRRPRAFRPRFG